MKYTNNPFELEKSSPSAKKMTASILTSFGYTGAYDAQCIHLFQVNHEPIRLQSVDTSNNIQATEMIHTVCRSSSKSLAVCPCIWVVSEGG